jgi:hypothetical protein
VKKQIKHKINGQFAPRTIAMLRSPAYRVLSLAGRRVLDRLEIELADHGGKDNGKLPVTYADFSEYGIHHHGVGPGLREAEALGFIETTEHGRAGNGEYRTSNRYRVTYLSTNRKAATNEWQNIKTIEDAETIAAKARRREN